MKKLNYMEYVTDLLDVAIFVSREDDEVMTGEEFVATFVDGENVHNLDANNSDDLQLIGEIHMQWKLYVKDNVEVKKYEF